MLAAVLRLHPCLLAILSLGLGACVRDSGSSADSGAESRTSDPESNPGSAPEPAAESGDPSLGQLRAGESIDLRTIIRRSPAEVDAVLGEPLETGSDRISCVRFVPERVFFACTQEIRLYGHPSFESIRVEFEDGHAAVVALAGLPGEGAFEPEAALASLGLTLPEPPHHDTPALNAPPSGEPAQGSVDRWEWGNSRARLRIDGLEHRVRLTVVDGDWRRAKLELIENNPLSPAQEAKIKPPRG
jgi:hypothetical protein